MTDRRRVLLVEDYEDLRLITLELLTHAGHDVEASADARDALMRARLRRFDVALVDLHLPIVDGWSLVEQLRRERFAAPIVAITTESRYEELDRARRVGCDAVWEKPVTDVVARIEAAMRGDLS